MRRSRSETKDLLLRTALSLLHERGLNPAVTHVRLTEVVKVAGLTTGAAYKVWDRQEDFHRDLAVAALEHRPDRPISQTVQLIHKAVDQGAPPNEMLRIGALAHLHEPEPGNPFLISLTIKTLAPSVPEIAVASRNKHEDSVSAFEELYRAMLVRYRRRIRAPFELRDMANVLAALSEGFALQTVSGVEHPVIRIEDEDPAVGEEWTLLAVAVQAVVDRFTEPIPEEAHVDA